LWRRSQRSSIDIENHFSGEFKLRIKKFNKDRHSVINTLIADPAFKVYGTHGVVALASRTKRGSIWNVFLTPYEVAEIFRLQNTMPEKERLTIYDRELWEKYYGIARVESDLRFLDFSNMRMPQLTAQVIFHHLVKKSGTKLRQVDAAELQAILDNHEMTADFTQWSDGDLTMLQLALAT
jgi:hypothetical protein